MCCLVKAIALHRRKAIYQYAAMDSSGKPKKLGTNSFSATFFVTELAGSCPGEAEILHLEPAPSILIFADSI